MIALITFRGREHSRFTGLTRLGAHALRAFTGRYDLLGSPLYSEGEILIDSVYRFKGQSAPCVIFTEIDFAALGALTRRKLFVGITRAAALRYAARGFRVNAVCPGVIATSMTDPLMKDPAMKARIEAMTPMQRMGTPEEIAEAVSWLCSAKASFVTGQALAVDGGCLCR